MILRAGILLALGAITIVGIASLNLLARQTVSENRQQTIDAPAGAGSGQRSELTSTKSAAATVDRASSEDKDVVDWNSELDTTANYLHLVEQALPAVQARDGAAAYAIARALSYCATQIMQVQRGIDPMTASEAQQTKYDQRHPARPAWAKQTARLKLERCIELARSDPFKELPRRAEGYMSSNYWMQHAVELGSPAAKASQVSAVLANAAQSSDGEARNKQVAVAEQYVNEVLASKDGDAIFTLGMSLTNQKYSSDPSRGTALTLAACELGADCSGRSSWGPTVVRCDIPDQCDRAVDYHEALKQDLGVSQYTGLYARAQALADAIRRGDSSILDEYSTVNGTLVSRN